VWYALLFHLLIEAIPPAVTANVRSLIQRCMTDLRSYCRVAWLPHTHHLFPDPFKVMRFGWFFFLFAFFGSLLTPLEGSCGDVPAVCQEGVHDDAPRHPPHDHCTMGSR
jgi:hypothetical protein